jgi:predicted ATPase
VKILVTSRARLRVAGERIVDVAPLSVEPWSGARESADAVALFAQAATAVDPHFHLERSLDDVIAICRAVDGLPLAIELAAGHLRTLPPGFLRHRLGTRLGSPLGASRDAHPRQQTIPATIDWSLQLLGPAEQRLFARLGIFNGPADLTAVEQVCGAPEDDVVSLLSHLVDQSLVRRVTGSWQEPRFVLLELVRAQARELMGAEYDVIADRHAEHVVRFVEDVDERRWSDLADRWIDLITESLSEIRAAHARAATRQDLFLCARIAAALGTYWHLEGHHVEGRKWISAILDQEAALDPHIIGRIHIAAGFLEWTRSQYAARSHWQRAIELMRVAEDSRYLAYSLALVSATFLGDADQYERAMTLNDEAVELARRVGERPLLVQVLNIRGELTRVAGQDDRALAAYTEALDLADAVGDQAYVSALLANLSYLANHRGEYDRAWGLVREALRICWSLGRRMMAAWTVSELAGPELGCGRPERAAILIGAADEAMRALGSARHPGDMPEYEQVVAGLKQALGEPGFARLTAEGGQLSLKEAVELALSDDIPEAMASI